MHLWPCSSSKAILQKAVKILKNSIFEGSNVDPCLDVKKNAKGVVYVALYADHNLMVGDADAVDNAISARKDKSLVLKTMNGLQDFLSCKITFSKDKKKAWSGQPHLIKNVEKKFHECVQDVQSDKKPGMPLIISPMVDNEKISAEDQQEYWFSAGILLYLVKHVQCNLANMIRELSKANDGVNPAP